MSPGNSDQKVYVYAVFSSLTVVFLVRLGPLGEDGIRPEVRPEVLRLEHFGQQANCIWNKT